jgi:hypothetical protein
MVEKNQAHQPRLGQGVSVRERGSEGRADPSQVGTSQRSRIVPFVFPQILFLMQRLPNETKIKLSIIRYFQRTGRTTPCV